MNPFILVIFEIAYSIILVFLGINLYSRFPEDNKRKIFATILCAIAFYYFLFSIIQISNNEKIVKILNQFSLAILLISSSLSLLFLSDFINHNKEYFIKFSYLTIFTSIVISFIFYVLPNKVVDIVFYKSLWVYKLKISYLLYILLGYFLSIFLTVMIFFISLIIEKNKIILKYYSVYSIIFLLPFVYFVPFLNPITLIFLQNFIILIWAIANYFILEKYDRNIINYYKSQVELVEELSSFQFLVNKDFIIIDSTDNTNKKLGYTKNEILGNRIDYIIKDISIAHLKKYSEENKISGIYKLIKKDKEEIITELNLHQIKDKKNNIQGYVLICNDYELKQKYEFESKKEIEAKYRYIDLLNNLIKFLDNLDDAVAFIDELGRVVTANKVFLNFYKNLKEQILSLEDFINSKEKSIEKVIEFIEDSKIFYYRYLLSYVTLKKELIDGYISVIENCSKEIKIKRSYQNIDNKIKKFIYNFPFIVIIIDKNGKIIFYSKKFIDFLKQYSSLDNIKINEIDINEIIETLNLQIFLSNFNKKSYTELLNYSMDLSILFNKNIDKKLFCNIRLFNLDESEKIYCIIIENLNDFYNYKIKKENLKKIIDCKINEKALFLSSLAYRFRIYLLNIIETIYLIRNEEKTFFNEIIEKIFNYVEHFIFQIDNIILYEIIENNKIEINYKLLDIVKYIENKVKLYSEKAKAKNISFKYHFSFLDNITENQNISSINILFDISFLDIILNNLFSNALKFTEKGEINFYCKLSELGKENYELYFKVQDTGVGIEKSKLNSVFERFYQIDDLLTKRYEGLGLGLFINKKLIEYFGGEINIDSEKDKGTSVTVKLPIMKSEIKDINIYKNTLSFEKINFIITFQSNYIHDLINKFNQSFGSSFLLVDSLYQIVNNIKKEFINLIIYDLDTIIVDELKFIEKIVQKNRTGGDKIIFFGIYSYPFFDEKVRKIQNYSYYIIRPLTMEKFIEKIKEIEV